MKGNYFLGDRQFQVREMSFPPLGDFEVKSRIWRRESAEPTFISIMGKRVPQRLLLR